MADFSKPVTTDNYTAILQEIRDLADSLAKLQNGTTDTNIPNGAIRWSATNNRFEIYDSATSTWSALATKYAIAISGNADTATDADTVDGIHASTTATANKLLALDANAKLQATAVNADKVINKTPTATPTANAIPIADAGGKLDGWVTGSGLGVGQTWQDVTASRAISTTYTNSTGRTIVVNVTLHNGSTTSNLESGYINSNVSFWVSNPGGSLATVLLIVPNGNTYSISSGSNLSFWYELR